MELETLRDLYINELKDLYSAEKQIVKALPKMVKAASNAQLKAAFQEHLRQTERQVERLEQVFEMLGASPRGKKCVGMEGLIEEAQELISEKPEPEVLDAGLLAKAQHVEHYEMAGYGTVRTYARQLGEEEQAQLLQETLDEEGETDKLLTELAESSINLEAEQAGDEEEEEEAAGAGRRGEREVSRGAAAEGGRGKSGGGARKRSGRGGEAEAR
ncbi:MAG TPA: ferritin-like domain-containing protein [Gemmatimonadaceae bacterium]|nr:ferritin-like domain-containing protein [Gemmatimonadaceae bacterium]